MKMGVNNNDFFYKHCQIARQEIFGGTYTPQGGTEKSADLIYRLPVSVPYSLIPAIQKQKREGHFVTSVT